MVSIGGRLCNRLTELRQILAIGQRQATTASKDVGHRGGREAVDHCKSISRCVNYAVVRTGE
jgi:hypothetical protein